MWALESKWTPQAHCASLGLTCTLHISIRTSYLSYSNSSSEIFIKLSQFGPCQTNTCPCFVHLNFQVEKQEQLPSLRLFGDKMFTHCLIFDVYSGKIPHQEHFTPQPRPAHCPQVDDTVAWGAGWRGSLEASFRLLSSKSIAAILYIIVLYKFVKIYLCNQHFSCAIIGYLLFNMCCWF